jgi:uncharacterized membrane protein YbaN (DUF454 family)
MNTDEAKQILLLYRARDAQEHDPEMLAALELAKRDPELHQWFEDLRRAQAVIQDKLRHSPVPSDLKDSILAGRKIVRPALWWHQPAWLAAAAAVVLLIGLAPIALRRQPSDQFTLYRARMVRMALHEYHIDIVTNDLQQVRHHLAAKGSPANFPIPTSLKNLAVTGGGHIRWGKAPASMVCFDRGDKQMLFLFVINPDAIKGEPHKPELAKIGALQTVSWTEDTGTYVVAGPDDPEFLKKYAP